MVLQCVSGQFLNPEIMSSNLARTIYLIRQQTSHIMFMSPTISSPDIVIMRHEQDLDKLDPIRLTHVHLFALPGPRRPKLRQLGWVPYAVGARARAHPREASKGVRSRIRPFALRPY